METDDSAVRAQNDNEEVKRLLASGSVSVKAASLALRRFLTTFVRSRSRESFVEITRLLLQHGADPDRRDDNGRTVLHDIVWLRAPADVVRVLLEEGGANPNTRDCYGSTPFHVACICGRFDVGKAMLQHGADLTIRDGDGSSALDITARRRDAEFLRLLLEHGGSPNSQKQSGGSLLHFAASWDHSAIVQVLLEFGADTKAENRDGKVPFELACEEGHTSCIFLLLQHMLGDGSIIVNQQRTNKKRKRAG